MYFMENIPISSNKIILKNLLERKNNQNNLVTRKKQNKINKKSYHGTES